MTYVPLIESPLWLDMLETSRKHQYTQATKMHHVLNILFRDSGYMWSEGILKKAPDKREFEPIGTRYTDRLDTLPGDDGKAHPLYAVIPRIADRDYLISFCPQAKAFLPGSLPLLEGFGNENAFTFPKGVDIHYLTAALLLLKPACENPVLALDQSSSGTDRACQSYLIGQVIHLYLDYIVECGLEDDFRKSCAEFSTKLSLLTALHPAYAVRIQRQTAPSP